uniref:CSON010648 protein n=1 Tax=Culicoides sonorensis TaxID=179676 RepID=A0A336M7I2_CULSO
MHHMGLFWPNLLENRHWKGSVPQHSSTVNKNNNSSIKREDGLYSRSGQIELTATELILHRKGRESTYWPLKCLRKYGHDSDMFSFESGRRCATGEGIYAFRCKRADLLFRTLQECLHRRAFLNDDRNTFPVPANMNGPSVAPRLIRSSTNTNTIASSNTVGVLSVGSHVTNRTVLTVSQSMSPLNSSETTTTPSTALYLEPQEQHRQQSRFVTGTRIGSMSSGGPISPDLASPGSPGSFTNILEVTALPNTGLNNNIQHGISNLYQEFPVREFNNNKRVSLDTPPAEPAPTVAMAANMTATVPEEEMRNYENTSPISLKHSMSGTSAFSNEQQTNTSGQVPQDDCHSYMNVDLGEANNQVTSPPGDDNNTVTVRTPTVTPTAYGFKRSESLVNDPSRSYENMEPLLTRMRHSKPEIFSKVDLPSTPTSFCSTEERTMNYIVLDLDNPTTNTTTNHNNNIENDYADTYSLSNLPGTTNALPSLMEHRKILQYSNSFDSPLVINSTGMISSNSLGLLTPESPTKQKARLGYALIDFNKTVALSNTVSNSIGSPTSDYDAQDGSRRTRHS